MMKSVAIIAFGYLIAACGSSIDPVMYSGIFAMAVGWVLLMISGIGTLKEKQTITSFESTIS